MTSNRARTLRKNMTDGERRLWHALRARQVDGMRFRRQHPIGPYIADFVCLERRLVVEVDGAHHTEDDQIAHDIHRDRWLNAEGYRVLRFPAIDAFQDLDGVVDSIWARCRKLPMCVLQDTPTRTAIGLSAPLQPDRHTSLAR